MSANEIITLANTVGQNGLDEVKYAADQLALVGEVSSDMQARVANTALKSAKTCVKVVHDQRMSITRRIDQFKKSVIAEEDMILANLNEQVDRVSKLIASYAEAKAREEEARAAAERERIMREQAEAERVARMEAELTGKEVIVPAVELPKEDTQSKPVAGVSTRTVWTFDIVDAAQVPREYCVPDERLIRRYMEDAKKNGAEVGSLNIPGVNFRKEIRV